MIIIMPQPNLQVQFFQMSLLDFGASRAYEREFIDKYIEVIKAAVEKNRPKVLKLSLDMGFLTGYESKVSSTDTETFINENATALY